MRLLVLKTGALSRATYEWGEMIICPLIWVALIYCALKGGGRDRGGGDLKTVGSQKDLGSKHCFRVRTLELLWSLFATILWKTGHGCLMRCYRSGRPRDGWVSSGKGDRGDVVGLVRGDRRGRCRERQQGKIHHREDLLGLYLRHWPDIDHSICGQCHCILQTA